jgi:dienelactone hydrolase
MRRSCYAVLGVALTLASGLVAVGSVSAAAADPAFTVTTLHFKVTVGPEGDTKPCDIVGDLYRPTAASPENRMPAVLSTNGFGGSKDDQVGLSTLFAKNGYVALSYSGLGFGGSGCEIALDDPDYDGKAAAQLIDYLGGKDGIAYTDAAHTTAAPALDVVTSDTATSGRPNDPRVGMFGGSYGGQVQYAAASVTPKLDTIVPIITWNDLSYSLGPNNTDQKTLPGQEIPGVSTDTPGSVKTNWALAFSALGLTGDPQNQQPDNPISTRCPNFVDFVCPALVTGATTGALDDDSVQHLRHASVASYQDKVKIPTLILQGQADTLFNLNEAVATYQALEKQGTEVKMSWIEYGHSGDPAKGEIDFAAPNPQTQHLTKRIFDWFEHYLQDKTSVSTGPEFSYFRDWVAYDGIATPAYASASSYPVGTTSTYHLSSTPGSTLTGGALVTDRKDVKAGNELFTAPAGPASNGEDLDVISGFFEKPEATEPVKEAPGTAATYDTSSLTKQVDVVGSPQVQLQVQAPTARVTQGQDTGKLVLYLKIADVAPGGTATVVRNLAAPVRVPDVDKAFTVKMPAFAHRFAKGHKIRLLVAGASPNYRGNNAPVGVGIATTAGGSATARSLPAQSVTLPTLAGVPASGGPAPATTSSGSTSGGPGTSSGSDAPGTTVDHGHSATGSQGAGQAAPAVSPVSASTLPDTGGPPLGLLVAGLLLVVLGAQLTRRSRLAPVRPGASTGR